MKATHCFDIGPYRIFGIALPVSFIPMNLIKTKCGREYECVLDRLASGEITGVTHFLVDQVASDFDITKNEQGPLEEYLRAMMDTGFITVMHIKDRNVVHFGEFVEDAENYKKL